MIKKGSIVKCFDCGDLVFTAKTNLYPQSVLSMEVLIGHQGHSNGDALMCLKCYRPMDYVTEESAWTEPREAAI